MALVASWGILGVLFLIGRALWNLTPIAWEAVRSPLTLAQWTVCVVWLGFMAVSEGYIGFHLKFSPRVVDRALYLGNNPTFLRVLLAAPFCIGMFHASRRVIYLSWGLVLGISALIAIMRFVPQPWRGIIDAGVVVGLGIGIFSVLFRFVHALITERQPQRHEVPTAPALQS